MGLRQLVTAASTIIVAIVLAISVPVSQLHTVGTQIECCCPDPDQCKCPGHDGDELPQPTIRACHKTQTDFAAPVLPAFVPPPVDLAFTLERVAFEPVFVQHAPHPSPAPPRPDAPS